MNDSLIKVLILKKMLFALFISIFFTNHSWSEVIVITGQPTDWCTDPGHEIIDKPPGTLDQCKCSVGWVQVGSMENDQPQCTPDTDGDSQPLDPDPGLTGGSEAPRRPTEEGCKSDLDQCIGRASDLVENCISRRADFYGRELANGRPCHGQSVEELLDGFKYTRLLFFDLSCEVADFEDIDDPGTDNCRIQFRKRGMGRCMQGVKQTTTSQGGSNTVKSSIKVGNYELGGSSSRKVSVSVTTRFGMGAKQFCSGLGEKATDECSAAHTQCLNVARGQAPFMVIAPLTTAERYIERIDKQLLGFPAQGINTPVLGSSVPFRSLSLGPLEAEILYLTRLKFLAKWSEFLKRESVSDAVKDKVHKAFASVQSEVTKSTDFYVTLQQIVWTIDVETGEPGSDESRKLLESFDRKGGIGSALRSGDVLMREKLEDTLGAALSKKFFGDVWPGVLHFSFSRPMSKKSVVIGETGTGGIPNPDHHIDPMLDQ